MDRLSFISIHFMGGEMEMDRLHGGVSEVLLFWQILVALLFLLALLFPFVVLINCIARSSVK